MNTKLVSYTNNQKGTPSTDQYLGLLNEMKKLKARADNCDGVYYPTEEDRTIGLAFFDMFNNDMTGLFAALGADGRSVEDRIIEATIFINEITCLVKKLGQK